jgi:predicted RNA-binding Zn-ribbon protein involved in translation (DUF1610 family)
MNFDKRIEMVKKGYKDKNYEPSYKELEEAYGNGNKCISCGDYLAWGEATNFYCFWGGEHKFGCSPIKRILGTLYTLLLTPIYLIIFIIQIPIYLISLFWVSKDDN